MSVFLEAVDKAIEAVKFNPFYNVPDDISPAQVFGFTPQSEAERQAWLAAADKEFDAEYARLKVAGLSHDEIIRAMCA